MAAAVKVHGPPLSTAVSRVLACLVEKDVPFQVLPVNMAKGEHKKPEYLKIQPYFLLCGWSYLDSSVFLCCLCDKTESRAILRYICDKYATQGNKGLYGTNPLEKASIDQWLEAEGQSFNLPSSVLVFQLAFAPMMKIKQDEDLIKQNEAKLVNVLDVYEKRLGESRFLAGDEFTLADLSHLPNAHYLVSKTDRRELITSRKNVERWWGEISSRICISYKDATDINVGEVTNQLREKLWRHLTRKVTFGVHSPLGWFASGESPRTPVSEALHQKGRQFDSQKNWPRVANRKNSLAYG
ncbi:Glutathione S-transferase F9 [Striga hermonthica]|uniref:glutathione transferase n=1 Tax=Striga hermonthica TaxID=68872 RepID=A0A9N7MSZ6_STRHE|nr:Glutathione S-transferase F9 [Striga hermonthica]